MNILPNKIQDNDFLFIHVTNISDKIALLFSNFLYFSGIIKNLSHSLVDLHKPLNKDEYLVQNHVLQEQKFSAYVECV